MENTVNVNAPFPLTLAKQARVAAAINGISRAELIRRAVGEYLKRLTVDNENSPHWQSRPSEKANYQSEGAIENDDS